MIDELTVFYFADRATLRDVLTMVDVLSRSDIDAGFVSFSRSSGLATLALRFHEDTDINNFCNIDLLGYPSVPLLTSIQSNEHEQLDQVFDVPAALRLVAMLDFDFLQTKKISKLRHLIATEYGIDIDCDKTFKNPPNNE